MQSKDTFITAVSTELSKYTH